MARPTKTPEQFAAELAEVSPTIKLQSSYKNARTKVSCRCSICGHQWEATPNHLLRGSGCPQCAGTMALSSDEFAKRVEALESSVELLSPYVNARTRVQCRCPVCGALWSPYPKSLLQGYGCPKCAERSAIERLSAMRDAPDDAEGR